MHPFKSKPSPRRTTATAKWPQKPDDAKRQSHQKRIVPRVGKRGGVPLQSVTAQTIQYRVPARPAHQAQILAFLQGRAYRQFASAKVLVQDAWRGVPAIGFQPESRFRHDPSGLGRSRDFSFVTGVVHVVYDQGWWAPLLVRMGMGSRCFQKPCSAKLYFMSSTSSRMADAFSQEN